MLVATIKNEIPDDIKIIGWQHHNYEVYFNTKGKRFYGAHSLFKKLLNNFDNYVVLTMDDKKILDKTFNMKTTHIFNPLSFENVPTSELENKVFIACGRIVKSKGFDKLIRSYKSYKELGGTWPLIIVGDGAAKQEVIKLVNEYNLNEEIQLEPFTNQIEKYLQNATIFLSPSTWEGFGLTFTEALVCGLPVIAYK